MIKKLLIFILSLVFAIWYSFAWTFYNNSTTSFTDIQLDNAENTIWSNSSKYLWIWEKDSEAWNYINNDMEWTGSYKSFPSSGSTLKITCKNWKIVRISSSYNYYSDYWIWNIDSVKITYWTGSASDDIQWSFTATCKPIAQPTKKFEETNIDYQTIKQKLPFGNIFPVTADKISIETYDIEKFKSNKNINNQPAFINIVYLQFEIIWNLSDSLINTKPHFDFSKLFKITFDTWYNFTWYNIWLSKFWKYSTKKEFVDAMSWAITLKDIWVAQDVINWLYDCANNNSCSKVIKFKHNILDTYDPYSLSDIQDILYKKSNNILYKKSNNILDKAINYYNHLSTTCNNLSSIQDTFLRKQTQNICKEILEQSVDTTNQNDLDNYNLWYGLWQRVKNLQTIETNFNSLWTWVNLLGIYNIYYELTYLNIWVDKLSYIKKATKESDTNNQYKTIRKIFENEKKDIENKKLVKDDDQKIVTKKKVLEKVFTPWTVLNNVVKNLPNFKPDTDIDVVEDDWKYIVIINWTTVVWDNVSNINNLGKDVGNTLNKKDGPAVEDSQEIVIDLWSDYAWSTVRLSFNVTYKWWWEDWTTEECKEATQDYLKIKVNDEEIFSSTYCYYNNYYPNSSSRPIQENITLTLDNDWKANLQFIVWSTSKKESADITDIKYKIKDK